MPLSWSGSHSPFAVTIECGIRISQTVDHYLTSKHNGGIAIDTVLHGLCQTDSRILNGCCLLIQLPDALQGDLFGLFRICGKIIGELCLKSLNAVQFE